MTPRESTLVESCFPPGTSLAITQQKFPPFGDRRCDGHWQMPHSYGHSTRPPVHFGNKCRIPLQLDYLRAWESSTKSSRMISILLRLTGRGKPRQAIMENPRMLFLQKVLNAAGVLSSQFTRRPISFVFGPTHQRWTIQIYGHIFIRFEWDWFPRAFLGLSNYMGPN